MATNTNHSVINTSAVTLESSSCPTEGKCCTETACTPLDWIETSRSLLVSDYNNCARQLNNKAFSIPFQHSEGCIDWRDGSSDKPITLANVQTRTGTFKHLFVGDDNKVLTALSPNKENGTQTLKYVADADAFMFVKDEDLDPCGLLGSCSSDTTSAPCTAIANVPGLSSSEIAEGYQVMIKSTVDGETVYCPRLVSQSTVLSGCRNLSTFPTVADTDKTYNATWIARNAGIADCECLELAFEESSVASYRKQPALTSICTPIDLTTPAVSGVSGSAQTFDFGVIGAVKPDWANRVIVRVSIKNGSVKFDDTTNDFATAFVADGMNDLASARIGVTDGTDSSFSGEVSLLINGTGFQLIAGSGIITDAGILASNAKDIFSAQVCIVGWELTENPA